MSDIDALVWAVEQHPRQRTTIAALALTTGPVDRIELRERVQRATEALPRLRQRVVSGPLPGTQPRWWLDDDIDLDFHLHFITVPDLEDAGVHEAVRDLIVEPFDRARPLWKFTLIEGTEDQRSALVIAAHHSVADGVRSVEMMMHLFEVDESAVAAAPSVSAPAPRPATAKPKAPSTTAHDIGATLGSAVRMLRPSSASSPVPTKRSADLDLRSVTVDLAALRAAGARCGGTVNDAFVAAVALGVLHHVGLENDGALHIAVPVNVGANGDSNGNHWTLARIELPYSPADRPDAVIRRVRQAMRPVRTAPSPGLMAPVAAAARWMPSIVTAGLFDAFSSSVDLTASNVPGSPLALRLCGRPIERLVPFGPLAGSAVNATLLSHAGVAEIGIASDPAAISEPDRLADEIRSAFHFVVESP